MWKNGDGALLATEMCVWSPLMQRHPPKSWALQQLGLDASHSEAFYSLWISVKSLSSHTALYSAPLFGTLGGHFTSNSVKERSLLSSTESVWFVVGLRCLLLSLTAVKSQFHPVYQISHNKLNLTYISAPADLDLKFTWGGVYDVISLTASGLWNRTLPQ